MAKTNPLAEGLKAHTKAPEPVAMPAPTLVSSPAPGKTSTRAKARMGTKLVGCHLMEDAATALKITAAEQRTTVQELLTEAIDMIFAKYGKPQIARRADDEVIR